MVENLRRVSHLFPVPDPTASASGQFPGAGQLLAESSFLANVFPNAFLCRRRLVTTAGLSPACCLQPAVVLWDSSPRERNRRPGRLCTPVDLLPLVVGSSAAPQALS